MDFDAYVAARYGRLIEHAVLLGCAEGEAGTVVDKVLVAERRRIRRAKDPDPWVREALEHEIRGVPVRRRHGGPIAAVALVAGVALVGILVSYQPSSSQITMPSLFGYDGASATAYLHQLGLAVRVDRVTGCEPLGQVIGSQPQPGEAVEEGSTVRVRTALPTDSFCLPDYDDRVEAWSFIRFALGGDAPDFAPHVMVSTALSAEDPDAPAAAVTTLTSSQAGDRERWGDVLDAVAGASRAPVDAPGGMAALGVDSAVPPASYCGRSRPASVDQRDALRVTIDTAGDADASCPLTVDLYRQDDGTIDTVVLYPAA